MKKQSHRQLYSSACMPNRQSYRGPQFQLAQEPSLIVVCQHCTAVLLLRQKGTFAQQCRLPCDWLQAYLLLSPVMMAEVGLSEGFVRPMYSILHHPYCVIYRASLTASTSPLQVWQAAGTGLMLTERLANTPPQLAPPLIQSVCEEIHWAIEDEPTQAGAVPFPHASMSGDS